MVGAAVAVAIGARHALPVEHTGLSSERAAPSSSRRLAEPRARAGGLRVPQTREV